MSLTGNQPRTEMLKRKIQWKTVDDANVFPIHLQPENDSNTQNAFSVTMSNQMIKVFEIEYIPSTTSSDSTFAQ